MPGGGGAPRSPRRRRTRSPRGHRGGSAAASHHGAARRLCGTLIMCIDDAVRHAHHHLCGTRHPQRIHRAARTSSMPTPSRRTASRGARRAAHRITASPHHRITASPHHRIAASPHRKAPHRRIAASQGARRAHARLRRAVWHAPRQPAAGLRRPRGRPAASVRCVALRVLQAAAVYRAHPSPARSCSEPGLYKLV